MAKEMRFDDEARRALARGVDLVAEAVRTTLGPKGRNVAIGKKYGTPTITHDGVAVAKEIELADPFENMGAQLLKEAATRTNDVAGDGTTTATIVAQAIVTDGLRNIASGANPVLLRRGLDRAVDVVLDEITRIAEPVTGKPTIAQIATISSTDPEIGELIASAFDRVGKDGIITVEESRGLRLEIEYVEGMIFDKGYCSPYLVTDVNKMIADLEDPRILITDKNISSMNEILPLLEQFAQPGNNFVIIADDVIGDPLTTLVVNRLRGNLTVLPIKAPGYGDRRKASLEDIAIVTGGKLISEELGRRLDSVTEQDLGRARRVIATKDKTTIVEGRGGESAIQNRLKLLRTAIEGSATESDKEKLRERIAKITGGVAVIKVGAGTEVELKEKRQRVEDALSATRAALHDGIVPGGGVALVRAAGAIDTLGLTGDERTGAELLRRALEAPMRQLAANAGEEADIAVESVLAAQQQHDNNRIGYDVLRGEFVDMIEGGIIDPAKVMRSAILNAVSVAGMILTTDTLVSDPPEGRPARRTASVA